LKLLKANQIDFPEFYAEYAIEDLGIFMDKLPMNFMPKMEADMLARGMVHPIIVFSPYEEWQRDPNCELPVNTRAKKEILSHNPSGFSENLIKNQKLMEALFLDTPNLKKARQDLEQDPKILATKISGAGLGDGVIGFLGF
jgi:hypothetical protein